MAFADSSGQLVAPSATGATPFTSLAAASAIGPRAVFDNVVCRANHTLAVTSSAGVSAGAVQFQGSLDGVNWFNLGSPVTTNTASRTFAPVMISDEPVNFLRANVTTAITAGAPPEQLARHIMTSPQFAADMAGFVVEEIVDVQSRPLDPKSFHRFINESQECST